MYIHDLLIKARHDEMLRAAAQYRLAALARRARTTPPHHAITAPQRQPGMRPHKLFPRSASLFARKAQS
jgi:hypothetical protein